MLEASLRLAALVALAVVGVGCAGDDEPPGEVVPAPTPTVTVGSPGPSPSSEPTATSSGAPSPSPSPAPASLDDVRLRLSPMAEGLDAPLLVTAPPDDPRLFVLEQPGRVRVAGDGDLGVYLDLTDRVTSGGERGLLGLAFHPDFAENGRLFVHYSGVDGRTTLSEFAADPSADRADPDTEEILLTVEQPASNHNGGTITFGPDGLLFLGLGDGGAANDRFGNGQDPSTLLGTILRLDVDTDDPYGIPPDNPFADGQDGAPEVWHYGLRNPYRFTFGDGKLWIGDVGQNAIEEIDAVPEEASGLNFGWPILEGSTCFQTDDCDRSGLTPPVLDYTHGDTGGCAIIGGEVYAGDAIPALRGHYFYSDLCAGFVASIRVEDGEVVDRRDWTDDLGTVPNPLSFGRDAAGEIYLASQDGTVYRIDPA